MSARSRVLVWTVLNEYGTTPVTTGAYVQLIPALTEDVTRLEIFDSSGSVMTLAYGPVGGEKVLGDVLPGGNTTPMDTILCKGMRLVIKAHDTNATNGKIVINGYL